MGRSAKKFSMKIIRKRLLILDAICRSTVQTSNLNQSDSFASCYESDRVYLCQFFPFLCIVSVPEFEQNEKHSFTQNVAFTERKNC